MQVGKRPGLQRHLPALLGGALAGLLLMAACSAPQGKTPEGNAANAANRATRPPRPALPPRPYALAGPLIPGNTTMISAWDIPADPIYDESLDGKPDADDIRLGYRIFVNTQLEAPGISSGSVTCGNCHLNAGQRERALPLVGVSAAYPEMNRRAERLFTIEDRIIECFMRSENGTGKTTNFPTPESREVKAVKAYLDWLSRGHEQGKSPAWRGKNGIPPDKQIPVATLDPKIGEVLFLEKCVNCHGADGQGVMIGDKKAAPLWGPNSWNDGAGAARVYTLAGIIRYAMPYLDPGSLTDEEAQQLAVYITSQPRPAYPLKDRDYVKAGPPVDAVYYPAREKKTE